jgi:hypothetical protein
MSIENETSTRGRPLKRKRWQAVALAAIFVGVLSGCGDASAPSGPSPTAEAVATLVKEGGLTPEQASEALSDQTLAVTADGSIVSGKVFGADDQPGAEELTDDGAITAAASSESALEVKAVTGPARPVPVRMKKDPPFSSIGIVRTTLSCGGECQSCKAGVSAAYNTCMATCTPPIAGCSGICQATQRYENAHCEGSFPPEVKTCAGVLVGARHVLTPFNCVYGNTTLTTVGTSFELPAVPGRAKRVVDASEFDIVHPSPLLTVLRLASSAGPNAPALPMIAESDEKFVGSAMAAAAYDPGSPDSARTLLRVTGTAEKGSNEFWFPIEPVSNEGWAIGQPVWSKKSNGKHYLVGVMSNNDSRPGASATRITPSVLKEIGNMVKNNP